MVTCKGVKIVDDIKMCILINITGCKHEIFLKQFESNAPTALNLHHFHFCKSKKFGFSQFK